MTDQLPVPQHRILDLYYLYFKHSTSNWKTNLRPGIVETRKNDYIEKQQLKRNSSIPVKRNVFHLL